jgi:ubiquinone biosynthesis protein COQ9
MYDLVPTQSTQTTSSVVFVHHFHHHIIIYLSSSLRVTTFVVSDTVAATLACPINWSLATQKVKSGILFSPNSFSAFRHIFCGNKNLTFEHRVIMKSIIFQLSTRILPRRSQNAFRMQQTLSAFSSFSTTTANDTSNDMNQMKTRLAQAAMKQVPTHGWTKEAITAAAVQDTKLSISMSGMLTPIDLVHWFMDDMNRQLREKNQGDSQDTSDKNKIFKAIQWRLQQVVPLVQCGQWHKGMALGISTPLTTKAQLHEFIEIISPPDASTEFQAALGAIFVATELHLLSDSSHDYQDTWSFLQQRLDDLEQYKDSNPGQLMMAIFPSSNPLDISIPLMASMAVASSLMEGAASLLMPSSARSVVGTKPSDYSSPPK